MALSAKQQAFVEHYLRDWNGYKAAIAAGYTEAYARHQASRLLSYDNIQAAIAERLAELKMSADEVLTRLADHARATIDDFIDLPEQANGGGWRVDLGKAQQRGKLHLIKKIKSTKYGPEIELYDAQAALALLGKQHMLFVDRTELTGKDGEPIIVDDARERLASTLARRAENSDPESDQGSDRDPDA